MPGGLWMRCNGCGGMIYKKVVQEKQNVCPECDYHFTISAPERVKLLVDEGTWEECFDDILPTDPLNFVATNRYRDKLRDAQSETGLKDAAIVGRGKVHENSIVLGVTDPRFIMGSMGSVVGEKLTLGAELALKESVPYVVVSGSGGGARMQEGALSLWQMAKTSAALARLSKANLLYVSILTNPTMGGTFASFASLGDIIIAEPKALLGFTGPRVIQQTIKRELPKDFQTSEFLLEHGFIDLIVSRKDLKDTLGRILDYCSPDRDVRKATAVRRRRPTVILETQK
ncbi:MAG: acetyl-CoA carboxylase carboxyltransferase subunit beta [Planctomycetes bacterium]|nr:acetyl-CoA carboxylase carboxyltransferase subunit beta [Planctomycetota bacterium]